MTLFSKTFFNVKSIMIALASVCLLTNCQEDEMLSVSENADAQIATSGTTESNVASLTISGQNTIFSPSVDCKTCTYVVAGKSDLIDGKALGLKPGSVICLDAALKYGNLTFINLEGTEENPITIGNSKLPHNQ